MATEKAFPRGGDKPAISKSKAPSFSLFKKTKPKIKKKFNKHKKDNDLTDSTAGKGPRKRPVVGNAKSDKDSTFNVKYVDNLKSVIKDGMLVLGMVEKITERIILISLPDGLKGLISISDISRLYTDLIRKGEEVLPPQKMFSIGETVTVKVVSAADKPRSYIVTSDPAEVNSKLSYTNLSKGLIFPASVQSEEEHGYIINTGIPHVNAFLHKDQVEEKMELQVGKIISCVVVKSDLSAESCSVQLSALSANLQSSVVSNASSIPVNSFVPGMQFEVEVIRILRNGLQVSLNKGKSWNGFIHEDYLRKLFDKPSNYPVGTVYTATLLYVKSLMNMPYFKLPSKPPKWKFEDGEIVTGKVKKVTKGGVIIKVGENPKMAKCFVPLVKLKNSQKILEKGGDPTTQYPVNSKVSEVRIGQRDLMSRYYVGTTDHQSIKEKYYTLSDITCGEVISGKIISLELPLTVLIGTTIKGVVSAKDLTDYPVKSPSAIFRIGQRVNARVLEVNTERRLVRLTMKPSLVKSTDPILKSYKQAQVNECYLGSVVAVRPASLYVLFYNGVTGIVDKERTPYCNEESLSSHYYEGQTVRCFVIKSNPESRRLRLSLVYGDESQKKVKMGKIYSATVESSNSNGLTIEVELSGNKRCRGKIPAPLITDNCTLTTSAHHLYSPGDKIEACCVRKSEASLSIFAVSETITKLYQGKTIKTLGKLLKVGSLLPFMYDRIDGDSLILQHVIPGFPHLKTTVERNNISDSPVNMEQLGLQLRKHQVVIGKILDIDDDTIEVSTKLSDTWDRHYKSSFYLLNSYINEMQRINEKKENIFSLASLGKELEGVVKEVKPPRAIVNLSDGTQATAFGKFTEKEAVKGKIVWADAAKEMFYINTRPNCLNDIVGGETGKKALSGETIRGRIVFISKILVVAALKGCGNGKLAFIPRKRHINELTEPPCPYEIGDVVKLHVERYKPNNLLAIDRKVVILLEKVIWDQHMKESGHNESKDSLKRKLTNETRKGEKSKAKKIKERESNEKDEIEIINEKLGTQSKKIKLEEPDAEGEENDLTASFVSIDEGNSTFNDMDIKSEDESLPDRERNGNYENLNKERIDLSSSSSESEGEEDEEEEKEEEEEEKVTKSSVSVGFNWDVLTNPSLLSGITFTKKEKEVEESSSDEETEESKNDQKKRKRLTKIERQEKARSEEERLRNIEEQLMDTNRDPQSADDFDRAVLSSPNSSALWLKYMAFHLQATEIEKARAVARRALKSISFLEEQEKLNIWTALLNLENLYGSDESVKKTMEEALQSNEPYRIHLHMLNLHAQSNRFIEMEKLGHFILRKYKDVYDVWWNIATTYYQVGKIESARNVLQKAITSLDKKNHVELIIKFALLENKHGTSERAQTLFETILSSFPKRVDVWSCYVDMLVKSNAIELARQVLERATGQRLPPKKMKILFKKHLAFEEAHGTQENSEKIREAAADYIQTLGTMECDQ